MSLLEDSLATDSSAPHRITARADPDYEANTGMFGGWTSALLLKAVLGHPDASGSASAMTVNFIERIVPGETIILAATRLGDAFAISIAIPLGNRTVIGDAGASAPIIVAGISDSDVAAEPASWRLHQYRRRGATPHRRANAARDPPQRCHSSRRRRASSGVQ